MKIKKIEVKNFKAVAEQTANFDGHSAIITGGNDKGKSSLLKGIIDRFRGEKPQIILKEDEEKGHNIMELTDGSKIEWKFTDKTESFAYITPDGIKQTTGVLKAIGEKYFGIRFDIDEFLNNSPKQQVKMLQKLVGIDFDDIDNRYNVKFEERKEAKKELDMIVKQKVEKPEQVEDPDIEGIKKELNDLKGKNDQIYRDWQEHNKVKQQETETHNRKKRDQARFNEDAKDELDHLANIKEGIYADCIDLEKAKHIFNNLPSVKEIPFEPLPEPEYYSTEGLEQKLQNAYRQQSQYENYEVNLEKYNKWVNQGEKAREKVDKLEKELKEIHEEKQQMINNANIPSEFAFKSDGVYYQGFPLQSNQISSSSKYIAALKLGSMAIGDVKAMYFDASFLDKNSLQNVQEWANKNDYQLLIERPDYEGGEIKYEII